MAGREDEAPPAKALSPAQWEAVRKHLHLVDEVSFRYFTRLAQTRLHYLRSLGTPGLEDAVRTFDPSKGAQLRTHAWRRIRGAIRDGLRKDGACADELIENGVLAADDFAAWQTEGPSPQEDSEEAAAARYSDGLRGYGTAWYLGWVFGGRAAETETLLQSAARTRLREEALTVVMTLPERERRVVELRHVDGLRWPALAASLAVSEATAHRHYQRAMVRLEARLRDKKVEPVEAE
jgi:RNA polymerase sigma factor (sigma-70 family)